MQTVLLLVNVILAAGVWFVFGPIAAIVFWFGMAAIEFAIAWVLTTEPKSRNPRESLWKRIDVWTVGREASDRADAGKGIDKKAALGLVVFVLVCAVLAAAAGAWWESTNQRNNVGANISFVATNATGTLPCTTGCTAQQLQAMGARRQR